MALQSDFFVTVGPSGAATSDVRPRVDGASRVFGSDGGEDVGSHVLIEPVAVGGIQRAGTGEENAPSTENGMAAAAASAMPAGIGSTVIGRVVGAGCNVRLCEARDGEDGLRLGSLVVGVTSGGARSDTTLTATVVSLPFRHVLPLPGGGASPDHADTGADVMKRVAGGLRLAMEILAAMRMAKLNLRPLPSSHSGGGPSTPEALPMGGGGPHRVCLVTSGHCAHVDASIAVLKHAYSAHVTLLICAPPSASSSSSSSQPPSGSPLQADVVASASVDSRNSSDHQTLENAAAASAPFDAVILQRSVASDEADEDDDTAMSAAVARLLRLDAVPPGSAVVGPAAFSPREAEHTALRSAARDAGVLLAPAALSPLLRSRWCASDARVVLGVALALLVHGFVDLPIALVSRVKGLARTAPAAGAGGGRTDSAAAVARAFERAVEDCRRLPAAVAAKGAVVLDLDIAAAAAELRCC